MAVRDVVQAAAGVGGGAGELAAAIDFDGTNDYLSRSSDMTGNADSKTFTLSFWMYQDRSNNFYPYVNGRNNVGTYNFYSRIETDGQLQIAGYATGGSTSKVFEITLSNIPEQTWTHI